MPFWREIFLRAGFDTRYVIAVRHPASVAASLARRDGLTGDWCYRMWLEHMVPSLQHTHGALRVVVDHDRLLASPDQTVRRIAARLDLPICEDELERYRNDFLEPGLRHSQHTLDDLPTGEDCPALVRDIYSSLTLAADDLLQLDDEAFLTQAQEWAGKLDGEFLLPPR